MKITRSFNNKFTVVTLISMLAFVPYQANALSLAQIISAAKASTEHSSADVMESQKVEFGFSPDAGAEALVLKTIDLAQHTIRLIGYSFTSKPIVQALVRAHRRGVDVKCVLDKSNTRNNSSRAALNLLVNSGIETRIDSMHAITHDKFQIIDNKTVETGSFNYSAAAAHSNAENVIVIWNNQIVAHGYTENWTAHYSHSEPWQSEY